MLFIFLDKYKGSVKVRINKFIFRKVLLKKLINLFVGKLINLFVGKLYKYFVNSNCYSLSSQFFSTSQILPAYL